MFRPALRRLAQSPLFTGLVLLALAPGLGAAIAVFSLVNALFLRPLPVKDAGRVMGVYETRDGRGYFPLSLPDYVGYRDAPEARRVWSALASHYPTAPLSLAARGVGVESDESVEINGSVVSANYFSVLGIAPALGRFFLPGEDAAPGTGPVVVVSHRLWRSRFGSRRDILGQVLQLNHTAFTVVGVAPERFEGVLLGIPSDVWLPNSMAAVGYRWCDARDRDCTWLNLIGRLAPGRTLEEAQARMTAESSGLRAAYPGRHERRGVRVTPLRGVHPAARAETLRLAALLLAAVTLVLAVAGANLSSLLLLRSLTRRSEIALRLALGATRRRLVSQAVAETLLLALLGGGAGLLLASWFGRLIVVLYPSDVPLDLALEGRVLLYALLLSLGTGLLLGLVPALQTTGPSLVPAIREEASLVRHGRPRLLGLLIVAQVALSFVLLTSTGLLARSLENADRGSGIDSRGVVTLRLRPLLSAYTPRRGQAVSREALRRLARLPGVRSVSLAVTLPPWLGSDPVAVTIPGRSPDRPQDAPTAALAEIAPSFFATLGVTLLRGRDFAERDAANAANAANPAGTVPVAIVNRTLAHRLWPGAEAVGQRLIVGSTSREVVGVVPDLGYRNALEPPAGQVYLPYWQNAGLVDARLAVRVAGDPAKLLPAIRRELRAIDPEVPVSEVGPLSEDLDRFLAPVRVAGHLLGVLAGLALFLASVGLYAILSLAVAQRTRDIGIRRAIGASGRQVVALVVRDTTILVASALALGLLAAVGASRLLAHYLYGVSPGDPLTFGAALALLALLAALASWVPARRASRVDPAVALRSP